MLIPQHIAAYREKRAQCIAQARSILSQYPKGTKIPDAEEAQFDRLLNEADLIEQEIRISGVTPEHARLVSMFDSASAGSNRPQLVGPEVRAFHKFLKHGIEALSQDERAVMLQPFDVSGGIQAAQSTGSGGSCGYAVPNDAMHPLIEAMKQIGGVLPYCSIISSDTGADLPIPTDNETAIEGEIVTENSQHNEGDVTLSQVVLQSFLYSSKIVRVSVQLMDDAGFNFGDYVMKKLGLRVGRITAKHWVVGSGASQPRGIVTASSVGKTAASATAVTYDELVDVMHSVDPIYRAKGTWLMSDTTYAALRKLKDGQNRALYGEMAGSAPDMLLGRPIAIDPNMPSMTAGQKSILFGDLSSYYVRIVKGPRVMRLQERYAEFAQLGFMAFLRADGDLVDGGGGAVKALQQA